MNKFFNAFFFLAMGAMVLSCSSAKIVADHDPDINFNDYETYTFCMEDMTIENSKYPEYDNDFNRNLIKEAIEAEMEARGYVADASQPQLQVGFRFVIRDEEFSVSNCFDESEYSYWAACRIETYQYTEETLVIYVSDLNKNQVIWQSSMVKSLSASPKKLKRKIEETVKKIFKEYPVKPISNSKLSV